MALSHVCIYGNSGTGKTTLIAQIIKWFGVKAKVISCEHYAPLKKLMADGQVKFWNVNTRDYPFDTTMQACLGYWPEDVDDPESDLVFQDDFKEYPLRFYEGMATFGDYMMGSYAKGALAYQAGMGTKVGPGTRPGEDTVSFFDGPGSDNKKKTPVGSNSRSHYNTVQRQVHARVIKSYLQPAYVFWTSHEIKATKDEYGSPFPNFGAEVVGSAMTPKTPRWFDTILHLSTVPETTKEKLRNKHVIHLTDHYDPLIPGIPFKAKLGVPIEDQGDLPTIINHNKEEVWELMNLLFPEAANAGGK